MEIFGIVIVVAIVGFIIWKSFGSSDASVSVSAPAPAPAPAPVVEVKKAPTKAQLSSKTKKEIDDLAKNEWGITLDARETKDKMIAQFIKEAKAIIKAENSDDGDEESEA